MENWPEKHSFGSSKIFEGDLPSTLPVCTTLHMVSSKGLWVGDDPLNHSLPLLLLQILLVFFSTRFTHFLLKPLGQPKIVTDILGGVILGPIFLGRNKKFSDKVFPRNGTTIFHSLAAMGLNLFLFLIGVKTDARELRKAGKYSCFVGVICLFIPILLVTTFSFIITQFIPDIPNYDTVMYSVTSVFSLSSFAVISALLEEFKLLNSDIGRLALSASMVSDTSSWIMNTVAVSFLLTPYAPLKSMARLVSFSIFILVVIKFVRPAALWMTKKIPEVERRDEICIVVVLLWLFVCAFISELTGHHAAFGSFILGVAIPDGPPIGDMIVEKFDSMVSQIWMPMFLALTGWSIDLVGVFNTEQIWILLIMIILSFMGKILGAMTPSFYSKMAFRDALSLGFIMNSRGLVEILLLNRWREVKFIDSRAHAILVVSVIFSAAISTPLVRIIYKPSGRYLNYKRRTIQHSKPNSILRILTCIYDEENVPTAINILQASSSSVEKPMCIYLLHLVNLVGRTTPLLIAHRNQLLPSNHYKPLHYSRSNHIINAFKRLEQQNKSISLHPFTSISPYSTMYHDVCKLALDKKVNLIIIPFHKKETFGVVAEEEPFKRSIRAANLSILDDAPCSVGILFDRGHWVPMSRIGVLFFGGADDREVLSYAGRMANGSVTRRITLVRFLPKDEKIETSYDKNLDNDFVNEFRLQNVGKESVQYIEERVNDAESVMNVIREMKDSCELLMVGRRKGEAASLLEGLETWCEWPELGLVGDILASSDFKDTFSVLIVQQQTQLRLQLPKIK